MCKNINKFYFITRIRLLNLCITSYVSVFVEVNDSEIIYVYEKV